MKPFMELFIHCSAVYEMAQSVRVRPYMLIDFSEKLLNVGLLDIIIENIFCSRTLLLEKSLNKTQHSYIIYELNQRLFHIPALLVL